MLKPEVQITKLKEQVSWVEDYKTTDGKVYSSSWGHQDIADKVERFLKTKHPDSIVYQVVASSSEISKQITFNP